MNEREQKIKIVQHEVNLLVVIDEIAVREMNKLFRVYMCIASWRNELQPLLNNKNKSISVCKAKKLLGIKSWVIIKKYIPHP